MNATYTLLGELTHKNIGDTISFTYRDDDLIHTTIVAELRSIYFNSDTVTIGVAPHDRDTTHYAEITELPVDTIVGIEEPLEKTW
ncbi:hypothetical protein [Corynebacterium callunae]|uniref:Uncharacterized protein n=1 Tax=Corynebacterium callunae DSM 20147 TaxID=1121353 RepID=M1UFF6_9CORY|nr:hypothetical protein [Corynebacterium callunae]AGG66905.1 hypothetical protein H924_07315 [Corynebacterium callunae DSM 20147]